MNEADQPQIVKGLYQLHIDGGKKASAAGEKGLGAYGFVLCDPRGTELPGGAQGEVVGSVSDPHSAEYEALLAGLSLARQLATTTGENAVRRNGSLRMDTSRWEDAERHSAGHAEHGDCAG
jgi:ribonuclease HI